MRSVWLAVFLCSAALGCGGKTAADRAASAEAAAKSGSDGQAVPSVGALQRKIIYTANVELGVENFDRTPSQVEELARQHDGYVARSNVAGLPGQPRHGQWTVRVPVERYEAFIVAVRTLGEVRSIGSDSKDVSEEYYNVEARVRNKKQEEGRLLKLLDEATGKLKEVLDVERELSRVRGEIEQLEGRLRVLNDLTTLTTVEIRVHEVKDYVPEEAAGYGTQVRRALESSTSGLVSTGRTISIAIVAALPWLGASVVLLSPLMLWIRARRKRRGT